MSDSPSPLDRRQVAAFDFDGTLAKGDSLMPFLLRLLGGPRVAHSVLRHSVSFGLVALGAANRDLAKERFIAHILTGHSASEIHRIGEEYANSLTSTRLFPEMERRVEWHKAQGHELVMVSATLDVYLEPLAKLMGFDHLLCTRLEVVDGLCTGKLVGINVRAEEKARQLREWLNDDIGENVELWAYGNSRGDKEMLELADHRFWINRHGTFSELSNKLKKDS